MSLDPEIRKATHADLSSIQALLRSTWHATYDEILGRKRIEELSKTWHHLDRLQSDLDRKQSRFLVLLINNQIKATAFVYNKNDVTIIGRVYVHPDCQNSGLGTLLMKDIMAHESQGTTMRLTVEPNNNAAIQFYQKLGFEIEGPGSCSEDNHDGIPTLIMVRHPLKQ